MLWALTLIPQLSERFKGSWSFEFTLFTCKLLHWHAGPADLCLAPSVTFSGQMSYLDSTTANLIDSWGDSRVTQILWITKKPQRIFECRSRPRDKRDLEARNSYWLSCFLEVIQVTRWRIQYTNLEWWGKKKRQHFVIQFICNELFTNRIDKSLYPRKKWIRG